MNFSVVQVVWTIVISIVLWAVVCAVLLFTKSMSIV
jgi:hypothetical protein